MRERVKEKYARAFKLGSSNVPGSRSCSMKHVAPIVLVLAIATFVPICICADDDGWNEAGIEWTSPDSAWDERGNKITAWDAALKKAASEKKPLMLLIHRTWCGACKSLRPKFASSKEIEQLAVNFVMVKSADESEFADEQFSPDGGYIPRILFFDDAGRHMEDIVQREDKYKYFHPDPSSIVKAMSQALARVATEEPSATSDKTEL